VIKSQSSYVALWRRAKQAGVFPAELLGTFVAYPPAGVARVEILVEHQLPCLLEAQLFLVLQRTHAGNVAEMLAKGGRAHVCASRQLFHLHRLGIVLLQPSYCPRNLLIGGADGNEPA